MLHLSTTAAGRRWWDLLAWSRLRSWMTTTLRWESPLERWHHLILAAQSINFPVDKDTYGQRTHQWVDWSWVISGPLPTNHQHIKAVSCPSQLALCLWAFVSQQAGQLFYVGLPSSYSLPTLEAPMPRLPSYESVRKKDRQRQIHMMIADRFGLNGPIVTEVGINQGLRLCHSTWYSHICFNNEVFQVPVVKPGKKRRSFYSCYSYKAHKNSFFNMEASQL